MPKPLVRDFWLLQKISSAKSANGFFWFFRQLPLLGKHLGDQYRFRPLKNLLEALIPLYYLLGRVISGGLVLGLAYLLTSRSGSLLVGLFPSLSTGLGPMRTGALISLYFTMNLLASSGMATFMQRVDAIRYYRLSMPSVFQISSILDPLGTWLGRSLVWSLACLFFFSDLSPWESLAWSTAVFFFRLILSARDYQSFLDRGRSDQDFGRPAAVNFFLLLLAFGLMAGLQAWQQNLSTWGWLALLLLAYPAWRAFRFLQAQTSFDLLFEYSINQARKLDADVGDLDRAQVRLTSEDLDLEDQGRTMNLTGYAGLNELFFRRHRRLLRKPIQKRSLIVSLIALTLIVLGQQGILPFEEEESSAFLFFIPLLMYILCNGTAVLQAFYLNCDRGLRVYGFYREKKAVFAMFRQRLKSMTQLMALPTLACMALLLAYAKIASLPVGELLMGEGLILCYGFFFTLYPLFQYYVFQPFKENQGEGGFSGKVAFMDLLVYFLTFILPMNLLDKVTSWEFFIGSLVSLLLFFLVASLSIYHFGSSAMQRKDK